MVEIQRRPLRGVAIVLAALVLTGCGWHGVRLAPGGGADIADGAVPPERTEAVAASPSVEPGQPTAPPSDLIRWETNPIRRTSTGARVFSGTVTNTDDRWSIRSVLLELKLLDGNGELIETLYAEVQDLNPGDRGDYTIAVPSEVGFELSNLRLTWDWLLR
ncbi:MAG TPA: FxLYD domain-containing protein [Candidatus Limnocylindrales bacterium]|nr:FxLYD domain-containing protein [Candidatus Limnocylindrales bacterium]